MDKKRHHYLPVAYLKAFGDDRGRVRVYMKDDPSRIIHQKPDNIGFHKYFYSQPLPQGGKDHNTLEDFFCDVEGKWPLLVEKFRQGKDVNDSLDDIFAFVSLQRARVPASRDAHESMRAELVKATLQMLDAQGRLPPKPTGHEDLLEHVQVSIDPHTSIHGMVDTIRGTGTLLSMIGVGILRNETETPFLTSDNPVIWFDPSIAEMKQRPYTVQPDGDILFLFPIAPDLCIYGNNQMREQFSHQGLGYAQLTNPESALEINQHVCRFAYRSVFANCGGQEELVSKYAGQSPVVEIEDATIDGKQVQIYRNVFGKRPSKVKWEH